jgi:hypothetical protein
MEYIKVLAQSHEINKFLKAILVMVMVAGIISLATGLLLYQHYRGA